MTIPKFRVYDKVEYMMITTNDYEDLSDLFCCLNADDGFFSELMQSTGLFDMYDKEIFEGDVLKTSDSELAKVVWNKELACWEAEFLGEIVDLCEIADIQSNRSDCEIVGNIYENPELLEEEKCSILLK